MSKLRTFLGLLARGRWRELGSRADYALRLRRLRSARPFRYRRHGFAYLALPDDPISRAAFLDDDPDDLELRLWQAWLGPGDLALDGGANAGLYTFPAAARVAGGRVLAVDADARFCATIERTAGALGLGAACRTCACALGATDGETEFFFSDAPTSDAVFQSLLSPGAGFRSRRVPLRTLRTLVATEAAGTMPAAVKLDLEGAEPLALAGAPTAWFGADGPAWFLEINPAALRRFDSTPAAVLAPFASGTHFLLALAHFPPRPGVAALQVIAPGSAPDWSAAVYHNVVALPLGPAAAPRRRRIAALLPATLARHLA